MKEEDREKLIGEIKTFRQALDRWGEVPCIFSSYYKYSFYFDGETPEGFTITISMGGDHNDIYKTSVSAHQIVTAREIDANFISVSDDKGEVFSGGCY